MSDNSPTKKRKANDGRATVLDSSNGGGLFSFWLGYFSWRRDDNTKGIHNTQPTRGGENLTQMDRMENMMLRMEKRQLASMSSLERRCEKLEAECSSLKNMLKTKMEQDGSKFDSLVTHHEYNSMLVKNQGWEYSVPVHSFEHWETNGYDEDIAQYLSEFSMTLKDLTEKMRRGEFPDDYGKNTSKKGIYLDWNEDPILDYDAISIMSQHWEEFAMALEQFTPAFGMLPDGSESIFSLHDIQLPRFIQGLLKNALMHKPFQTLSFMNRDDVDDSEGMSVNDILDIVNSNKHLRKLTIGNNRIRLGHMEKICSTVRYGSIVELDLRNCFVWYGENSLVEEIVTSLLTNGGSKFKRLGLDSNRITSSSITTLANFLATNPPLQELDLSNNGLSGDCVDLLANALRSNRSLKNLQLSGNTINDDGKEAFRLVMHDDSSLNSIADSNHRCFLEGVGISWNVDGFWKNDAWHEATESFNRSRKIYGLLSERNKSKSTSNVQYFDEIDVKILPDMLKAIQRYAIEIHWYGSTKALSIVYEVMRKWDKVFPLYADRGNNNSD